MGRLASTPYVPTNFRGSDSGSDHVPGGVRTERELSSAPHVDRTPVNHDVLMIPTSRTDHDRADQAPGAASGERRSTIVDLLSPEAALGDDSLSVDSTPWSSSTMEQQHGDVVVGTTIDEDPRSTFVRYLQENATTTTAAPGSNHTVTGRVSTVEELPTDINLEKLKASALYILAKRTGIAAALSLGLSQVSVSDFAITRRRSLGVGVDEVALGHGGAMGTSPVGSENQKIGTTSAEGAVVLTNPGEGKEWLHPVRTRGWRKSGRNRGIEDVGASSTPSNAEDEERRYIITKDYTSVRALATIGKGVTTFFSLIVNSATAAATVQTTLLSGLAVKNALKVFFPNFSFSKRTARSSYFEKIVIYGVDQHLISLQTNINNALAATNFTSDATFGSDAPSITSVDGIGDVTVTAITTTAVPVTQAAIAQQETIAPQTLPVPDPYLPPVDYWSGQ